MLCANCRQELSETTPVCRSCPPGAFAATAAAPWAGTAAPWAAATAAPVVSAPARAPTAPRSDPPAAPPRPPATVEDAGPRPLTKKEKQARARERMAQRSARAEPDEVAADVAEEPAGAAFTRPRGLTLLATLDLLLGSAALALAGALYEGTAPAAFRDGAWVPRIAGYGVFGLACVAAGIGLLRLRPSGRNVQLALCGSAWLIGGFSMLAAIPIAIYLLLPGTQVLLSGRPPSAFTSAERERVAHARKGEFLVWFAAVVELGGVLAALAA